MERQMCFTDSEKLAAGTLRNYSVADAPRTV